MSSPVHITARQLVRLIGTPAFPVSIEVRIDADFDAFYRWGRDASQELHNWPGRS